MGETLTETQHERKQTDKRKKKKNSIKRKISEGFNCFAIHRRFERNVFDDEEDDADCNSVVGPLEPPQCRTDPRRLPRRKGVIRGVHSVNGYAGSRAGEDEFDTVQAVRATRKISDTTSYEPSIPVLQRQFTRLLSVEQNANQFDHYLLNDTASIENHLKSMGPEKAMFVVNQRVNVEISGVYDRFTALGYAISKNDPDLVELLLSHGADVSAKPNVLKCSYSHHMCDVESPLHFAALFGCKSEIVGHLLDYSAVQDELSEEVQIILLRYVASCTDSEVIDKLIEIIPDINEICCPSNRFNALHIAVKRDNDVAIKATITKGININHKDKSGKTPLMLAFCGKRPKESTVRLLIESGANVNECDMLLRSPLHYALRFSSKECVKLLLDAGADLRAKDAKGKNAINYIFDIGERNNFKAMPKEETKILVQLLLEAANGNYLIAKYDDFYQVVISLMSNEEVNERIIIQMMELNIKHIEEDKTLSVVIKNFFHHAITHQRLEVSKWLLNKGYDINCRDENGWTGIHLAVLTKNLDLIKFLKNHGADMEATTENGVNLPWLLLRCGMNKEFKNVVPKSSKSLYSQIRIKYLCQIPYKDLPLDEGLCNTDEQRIDPRQFARKLQRQITLVEFCIHMNYFKTAYQLFKIGVPLEAPSKGNGQSNRSGESIEALLSRKIEYVTEMDESLMDKEGLNCLHKIRDSLAANDFDA